MTSPKRAPLPIGPRRFSISPPDKPRCPVGGKCAPRPSAAQQLPEDLPQPPRMVLEPCTTAAPSRRLHNCSCSQSLSSSFSSSYCYLFRQNTAIDTAIDTGKEDHPPTDWHVHKMDRFSTFQHSMHYSGTAQLLCIPAQDALHLSDKSS